MRNVEDDICVGDVVPPCILFVRLYTQTVCPVSHAAFGCVAKPMVCVAITKYTCHRMSWGRESCVFVALFVFIPSWAVVMSITEATSTLISAWQKVALSAPPRPPQDARTTSDAIHCRGCEFAAGCVVYMSLLMVVHVMEMAAVRLAHTAHRMLYSYR